MPDFLKMHGAGNDFILLDRRAAALPLTAMQIRALADRRTGIGCDQVILLDPPKTAGADVFMRIHNPDGSAAGACGNATRCVAERVGAALGRETVVVETVAGLLPAERLGGGEVRVDMGAPRFGWRDIPLAAPGDTLRLPVPGAPAACSMGNPHVTLFVDDANDPSLPAQGAALEVHALFPDRANVGFAEMRGDGAIRLRVWERGAGLTLACGSGACAALVNAHRRGLAPRAATVVLDGGVLRIEWRESDSHVLMTGPTALAYEGRIALDALAG